MIRFTTTWRGYRPDDEITLDPATERRLVAIGLAEWVGGDPDTPADNPPVDEHPEPEDAQRVELESEAAAGAETDDTRADEAAADEDEAQAPDEPEAAPPKRTRSSK